MSSIDPYCLSSYMAFRYLVDPNRAWRSGIAPVFPAIDTSNQIAVGTPEEILAALKRIVADTPDIRQTGVFLSGGIDSAIVAALLPRGTRAYTINFVAENGAREQIHAEVYARAYGLDMQVVDVTWDDYLTYEPVLMRAKRAPLHAVEVALHKASLAAKRDGLRGVFVGNGADSTFGGMDKLLSRDWTFDEFCARYTFINPAATLTEPIDMTHVYEPYRRPNGFDVLGFLKRVHGYGIIQAFDNAAHAAGLELIEPFEKLRLRGNLDIPRIRAGEPKYLLVDVFRTLYPRVEARRKVPFARPMDEWLAGYAGPLAKCFKPGLSMNGFTGDQVYLIQSLDRFVDLLEKGAICP